MQGQGFSLDSIRQMAESRIMTAVDGVISRIPNGQQYKDQLRQAISGAMDDLQRQAQIQMSNLGGMMGGSAGRQPDQNPPVH